MFDRIDTLERDNLRLGGMLCVERKKELTVFSVVGRILKGNYKTQILALGSLNIFVKKKDGTFRIYIECRELNKLN